MKLGVRAIFLSTAIAASGTLVACASTAFAANIFVVGGKPDDPFWAVVKRGAENYGITVPTKEIFTGPGVIDKSTVDVTLKGIQAGVR